MDKEAIAQQIKQWSNRTKPERMAADIAILILAGRIADLPTNGSLAMEWSTTKQSAKRAKQHLAGAGLIAKDETGHYYIPTEARPAGKRVG